jgi:hypothetical protein
MKRVRKCKVARPAAKETSTVGNPTPASNPFRYYYLGALSLFDKISPDSGRIVQAVLGPTHP